MKKSISIFIAIMCTFISCLGAHAIGFRFDKIEGDDYLRKTIIYVRDSSEIFGEETKFFAGDLKDPDNFLMDLVSEYISD